MARDQKTKGNFKYENIEKKDKNFMYQNLEKSNCYNCNFSSSNFDYVNFRGAHFKSCSFLKCSFKFSEFIGSNFKKSNFKNAKFENTIFDSVRLDNVDFKDAKFKNTIFLSTDLSKTKNLNIDNPEIKVYNEMPKLDLSVDLTNSILNALNNKYVKNSRVLDTRDGNINLLSIMILLENFNEEELIKGLNLLANELDKDFYTLSYLIKYINTSIVS
ncbi:pentapeptide repeat-containing protein [uncultured Clostridium sp.]|uniref:pentapeptide repeat-containing protein n=1 Tax=uncultured Clostridium sp. TaxID=59620 RepID=UPI0025DD3CFE|nr:pentapeptide repeat-containing protein [uncultured Clostridium sp.]